MTIDKDVLEELILNISNITGIRNNILEKRLLCLSFF